MKKILVLLAIIPVMGLAQNNADSLINKYKLNFALPDFPAFKSLDIDGSHLLRPSNTTEFGVIASEFYNGKNLIIPESFALEVSPIL